MSFDLLSTVEEGGCSAKLGPEVLNKLLGRLNFEIDKNLLVGIDTHDDAAVYKLNEEQALIFTTDFFPPVCSDAYTFGQIAVTNSLSDIYAMGGEVLLALNLIMFPTQKIPLQVLEEILNGGQDKINEAKGLIVGGHTIEDYPPKYGLAVLGLVHPKKIVTNAKAMPGDVLILTKPLGSGTIMAGKRLGLIEDQDYVSALNYMKQLNKEAREIMLRYQVQAATDITGFGLLGHLSKMALASKVYLHLDIDKVPFMKGALELTDEGCIPGASFKNQKFVESQALRHTLKNCNYSRKMLLYDAQTSGGMLICAKEEIAQQALNCLRITYPESAIIGKVSK